MNLALWKKAVRDSRVFLLVCALLLLAFGWIFVWLMSLLPKEAWSAVLRFMPNLLQNLLGIPVGSLNSDLGQLSFLFVDVVTLLVCIGWAVGRGSDPVSGEIGRATMDLIVSLPIRRFEVIVVSGTVTAAGSAILAVAVCAGAAIGLKTVDFGAGVSPWRLLPGAVNLFFMTFCLTGVTTFLSSFNRDRWRTIWLATGFFVISTILKMVARLWHSGAWLKYLSFLTAFEPQELTVGVTANFSGTAGAAKSLVQQTDVLAMSLRYNGVLLAIGLAGYLAATLIFTKRDIPTAI